MNSKQAIDDKFPIVNIYYQGNLVGMYKAKLIGKYSMVLLHGVISFPVGTSLKVNFRRFAERKSIHKHILGVVRNNTSKGMLLRLQATA